MDDLWFEDELEPSPDTIESATGEIKGPTAEGLVAVARQIIRVGKPRWQMLGNAPMISGKSPVLWLVRLRFEFEPQSSSPFALAHCEAYLESVEGGKSKPSVYDLYPQNLYEGAPQTVSLKLEPTLKVAGVEASGVGVSADVKVGRVAPVVVGYSGEDERAPHWELRSKEHPIEGHRDFWLILEQPSGCNGIRLRARVEGIVHTHWGSIAVYPKKRVWNSRPMVVIGEPDLTVLVDRKTNIVQVSILLDKDIHEFTPVEQTSFVFTLSHIVNVAPEQIRFLRVAQGSVLITLEMPEDAAQILLSLYLQQASVVQTLQIKRVELKQLTKVDSDVHAETSLASVLFLAADPTNASRLRLGEELREIQEKLQLAKLRDHFTLEQKLSVRPTDVTQALLDVQPHIVHFSGHGAATGALYFENQFGELHPVPSDALASLFEQFSDQVKVVILNACYSVTQASAIAQHIDYVIGMCREIDDKTAIAFSTGFYQALGAGRSIEEAYKLGCVQIELQGIPDRLTPVLIKKGQKQS